MIGTCAFKSAPTGAGEVELAYMTFPAYEGRGHATAMAGALARIADAGGAMPIAHTLPQENASNKALRRNGFVFAGEVEDPEDGLVWRWERPARPVTLHADLYWSFRSPYSYLAIDRYRAMTEAYRPRNRAEAGLPARHPPARFLREEPSQLARLHAARRRAAQPVSEHPDRAAQARSDRPGHGDAPDRRRSALHLPPRPARPGGGAARAEPRLSTPRPRG